MNAFIMQASVQNMTGMPAAGTGSGQIAEGKDAGAFAALLADMLLSAETGKPGWRPDLAGELVEQLAASAVEGEDAASIDAEQALLLVRQWIAALEAADPEQAAQWLALPPVQQWMQQAAAVAGQDGDASEIAAVEPSANDIPSGQIRGRHAASEQAALTERMSALLQQLADQLHNASRVPQQTAPAAELIARLHHLIRDGELHAGRTGLATWMSGAADEPAAEPLVPIRTGIAMLQGGHELTGHQAQTANNPEPAQWLERLSYMRMPAPSILNQLAAAQARASAEGDIQQGPQAAAGEPALPDMTKAGVAFASTQEAIQKAADLPARPMPVVHADQFAQELSRYIVKNMTFNRTEGATEARISLVPAHLGHLDVKITIANGQITAHFLAESAGARELLENQLSSLRASLQQQGLQVDKLVVSTGSGFQSGAFQEQRQSASRGQTSGGKSPDAYTGLDELDGAGTATQTSARDLLRGMGSSFHASA